MSLERSEVLLSAVPSCGRGWTEGKPRVYGRHAEQTGFWNVFVVYDKHVSKGFREDAPTPATLPLTTLVGCESGRGIRRVRRYSYPTLQSVETITDDHGWQTGGD